MHSSHGPYDQIMLFGDSITEFSASQERGFAFMAALQDSMLISILTSPLARPLCEQHHVQKALTRM